jgi:hypothetical protein
MTIGSFIAVNALARAGAVFPGARVFRIWGGRSYEMGEYWVTFDPRTVPNYRGGAGLPRTNTGRFLTVGVLKDVRGVRTVPAESAHGNPGGLPSLIVPRPQEQIQVIRTIELNPPL